MRVLGIDLDKKSMKIGWGIDESVTTSPNKKMPLLKNAPSGMETYNSI